MLRSCFNPFKLKSCCNRVLSSSFTTSVPPSKRSMKEAKFTPKVKALVDPMLKPDTNCIKSYYFYILKCMLQEARNHATNTQAQFIKRFVPAIAYKLTVDSFTFESVKALGIKTSSSYLSKEIAKFFENPAVKEHCKQLETEDGKLDQTVEASSTQLKLINDLAPWIARELLEEALTFENVRLLAAKDPSFSAKVSEFFNNPNVTQYYNLITDDYKILYKFRYDEE